MSLSVAKKHGALVERLLAKTEKGQLEWTMGVGRRPLAKVGSYSVSLYEERRGGNSTEFIAILGDFDEEIESFTDEDLAEVSPNNRNFDDYWPMMTHLREVAFRQAVGAEKALDAILQNLEDDDEW